MIVQVDITNTGVRAGQEVVQLYVQDISALVARSPKELKGFAKLALGPGETQTVTLTLDRTALAFWDEVQHRWVAEEGEFVILVGSSSRDIHAQSTFRLTETIAFRGPNRAAARQRGAM